MAVQNVCVPPWVWRKGCLILRMNHDCTKTLVPWKSPQLYLLGVEWGSVSRRKVVMMDASKTGWGTLCHGRPAFGSWTEPMPNWHINCLEMMAVLLAFKEFQSEPCPGLVKQHDSGSLHKSPRGSQVLPAEQADVLPPSMGTVQPSLSEGSSRARLHEHWSIYAVLKRTTSGGMETPPRRFA